MTAKKNQHPTRSKHASSAKRPGKAASRAKTSDDRKKTRSSSAGTASARVADEPSEPPFHIADDPPRSLSHGAGGVLAADPAAPGGEGVLPGDMPWAPRPAARPPPR